MKTDRYTKAVLTIIAVLLACLLAQNTTKPASGQGPTYVIPMPGAVFPVSITSGPIPVSITDVSGNALPVNIVAVGGGNHALPVRVTTGP